ncbi:hypothetical protein L2E82_12503 [Cichorium intybus]|uniref:Uncharacterized protein n=1 Tax=Cichorium intybus TaxID=13427 RepID=A0ACB9GHH6_CICIN|nr:hypothetical protein L2E82_12503 [Cichorium intybus]
MFNLVGKNLTFSAFKTSVHRLFPCSLCSSQAASDNSFRVSYLIDSCGIPPDKAISASKYLKFKTADRAGESKVYRSPDFSFGTIVSYGSPISSREKPFAQIQVLKLHRTFSF